MLLHTFCHLHGIGPSREKALWASGCRSWDEFVAVTRPPKGLGLAPGLFSVAQEEVRQDLAAFQQRDLDYLARRLGTKNHWRFYRYFSDNTAFLDIETTGMDPHSSIVTVVGLYSPRDEYRVFINGINLDLFPAAIRSYDILVTFNGAAFDLPFLGRAFADLELPPLHIDLRWLCREIGLVGGLKQVELEIGIHRHGSISSFTGAEAVTLWHRFVLQDDREALKLLVQYNLADTYNLQSLLIHCLNQKYRQFPFLGIEPLARKAVAADKVDDPLHGLFTPLSRSTAP